MNKSIRVFTYLFIAIISPLFINAQTFEKFYAGEDGYTINQKSDTILLKTTSFSSNTIFNLFLDKNGNLLQSNNTLYTSLSCKDSLNIDKNGGYYHTFQKLFKTDGNLNFYSIGYDHFDKFGNLYFSKILDTISLNSLISIFANPILFAPNNTNDLYFAYGFTSSFVKLFKISNDNFVWSTQLQDFRNFFDLKFKLSNDGKYIAFDFQDCIYNNFYSNITVLIDNLSGKILNKILYSASGSFAFDSKSNLYVSEISNINGPAYLQILKFLPNGNLDTISNRFIYSTFTSTAPTIKDMLVSNDGSIYITGSKNNQAWLLKLNPDGSLDSAKTDIAVSITAPPTYKKYTPSSFTITAKNTGTTTATDIKIQLAPVANTVYGGTPTASAGDYKEFCPGNLHCRTWTIPNLNAGDSATLTVPVFVLDPNGANITGKVNLVSSTPTDGNATNDTATVIITPSDNTPAPVAKPDIAVSIASAPATYSKYTFLNYTLTAKNVGSAEMRDIKIKFTPPNGTANPGDTKASAGIYNDYCAGGSHCQTWSISVLGINQSATLIIPVFVLDPGTPITAQATLTASTPADANGTNDTGSITVAPQMNFSLENQQLLANSRQLKISPNPASDVINLETHSEVATSVQFVFYNMQGSQIKSEQRQLEKGINQFGFDISGLPSGLFYLQTISEKINLATVKFVKN